MNPDVISKTLWLTGIGVSDAVLLNDDAIPTRMAGVDRSMDPMEWAKFVIRNRDERNYVEAYSIFIRESKTDNPEAEYCLGLMYARGQGISKDHAAALNWFLKAYDHGYTRSGYFIGRMYLSGLGTEKDVQKAIRYLESVSKEDARAMYELGLIHFEDRDVPRDLHKSAEWMLRAANAGNAEAQFVLGQFYKAGAGFQKDIDKAVHWLTSAALNRHKGAQILLGNMYRTGDGVKVDLDESDRWYDMADGISNVQPEKNRGPLQRESSPGLRGPMSS